MEQGHNAFEEEESFWGPAFLEIVDSDGKDGKRWGHWRLMPTNMLWIENIKPEECVQSNFYFIKIRTVFVHTMSMHCTMWCFISGCSATLLLCMGDVDVARSHHKYVWHVCAYCTTFSVQRMKATFYCQRKRCWNSAITKRSNENLFFLTFQTVYCLSTSLLTVQHCNKLTFSRTIRYIRIFLDDLFSDCRYSSSTIKFSHNVKRY